jgi:Tol biopolymer transport system component
LAVLDTAAGKVTPVADVPNNGEVWSQCWSPDGKRIAYAWSEVLKGKPVDVLDQEIESQVVVCEPDGKNAKVIASEKGRLVTISGMDWR